MDDILIPFQNGQQIEPGLVLLYLSGLLLSALAAWGLFTILGLAGCAGMSVQPDSPAVLEARVRALVLRQVDVSNRLVHHRLHPAEAPGPAGTRTRSSGATSS